MCVFIHIYMCLYPYTVFLGTPGASEGERATMGMGELRDGPESESDITVEIRVSLWSPATLLVILPVCGLVGVC